MHRTNLIEQLKAYQAEWEQEAAVTDQFIQFVSANPDCFERTLSIGHVTGSAWVVNQTGTHVLLTHHRKLEKWLQLGGHADGDHDILRVASREVVEESGLQDFVPVSPKIFDIDVHEIPARGSEPAHYHYDVRFAMQTTSDTAYTVSDESHDLDWVAIAQLHQLVSEESMLRMAWKWQLLQQAGKL